MLPRILYSLVFYLLVPFICLRLWWRSRRVPAYRRRWRERFGVVPRPDPGREVIWVHAVSVGETIAAVPLVRRLQERYPDALIAVTTTTPTGSERVRALLGDSVYHSYVPYDLPDALARFLARLQPRLLIVMETELWPNLVHACARRDIPVVLANARLSEKSAVGYRRFAALTARMLGELTWVAAQHEDDGARFLALGLPAARLQVTGNIKFDFAIRDEQRRQAQVLAEQWRGADGRPVWLVASTHRGEDEIILDAFARALARVPNLLLVLVPRHPDRFEQVAALCSARGHRMARRSRAEIPDAATQVLLGDTMGELAVFFGACDIAFVAGSLVPVGGHNLLEPAAWGVPVLSGPVLFNFAEASALLQQADALTLCENADEIADAVVNLVENPEQRSRQGAAARAVVDANRGALARLMALIERLPAR
ncbi:MAG: lipid IV(A) 3-deoxy-D-manno-octulosonic acid transferase [Porticoccaceae bacterium]